MSDAIVAPSNAFLQDVLRTFPAVQKKATVTHNGIDLTEISCRELDKSNGERRRYLLCVADQNKKKGLDTLIDAFARLLPSAPDLTLVLAGDGKLRSELENLAHNLRVHDRIEFVGWKGRSDVANLLHGCKIFVLPSRSEPFGIAIVEAMACKKPVVASAVGGIPEIIQTGKNGILVEPDNPAALADAILDLLNDSRLQQTIAENGYVTAKTRFSFETMGMRYERMFADL